MTGKSCKNCAHSTLNGSPFGDACADCRRLGNFVPVGPEVMRPDCFGDYVNCHSCRLHGGELCARCACSFCKVFAQCAGATPNAGMDVTKAPLLRDLPMCECDNPGACGDCPVKDCDTCRYEEDPLSLGSRCDLCVHAEDGYPLWEPKVEGDDDDYDDWASFDDLLEDFVRSRSEEWKAVFEPMNEEDANPGMTGQYTFRGGIEPLEFITSNRMSFLEGNVIKYLYRYPTKGGLEALEKAKFYLEQIIQQRKELCGKE